MVARCGASDILLAVQPVGPNIERFFKLKKEFKNSKISCIADNEEDYYPAFRYGQKNRS